MGSAAPPPATASATRAPWRARRGRASLAPPGPTRTTSARPYAQRVVGAVGERGVAKWVLVLLLAMIWMVMLDYSGIHTHTHTQWTTGNVNTPTHPGCSTRAAAGLRAGRSVPTTLAARTGSCASAGAALISSTRRRARTRVRVPSRAHVMWMCVCHVECVCLCACDVDLFVCVHVMWISSCLSVMCVFVSCGM